MNLAIPLFGSRISPRFDFCQEILIVTVEEGKVLEDKTLSVTSLTPLQRIAELSNHGVKAIICGGISRMVESNLRSNGISVISDVMGEAEEALNRYLAGRLEPRTFCEGRRRRTCRRRGSPPWAVFPLGEGSVGLGEKEKKS